MAPLIAVALAGALGAAARFALDAFISRRDRKGRPWGTWAVNVSGSLLLGILAGVAASRRLPADLELVAGAGFLGAYTTFSTWMVQSVELAERGHGRAALVNLAGSLATGIAAAALGWVAGAALA